MSSTEGIFYRGTYGVPIEIELDIPLNTVTAIDLQLIKPGTKTLMGAQLDGDTVSSTLDLPGAIVDIDKGIVQFAGAQGDMDLPGIYKFILGLHMGPNALLNRAGSFIID